MHTCRRNKPVLQCETKPSRKPTTNKENIRSCTQRRLVVHRRSVRSVYYISKCSCNMKEWLFSTSNLKTLVPFWNCMDKNCPTPCRIPWNLVILSYSEWSFFKNRVTQRPVFVCLRKLEFKCGDLPCPPIASFWRQRLPELCNGESTIQSLPCEKRLCLQSAAHLIVRV